MNQMAQMMNAKNNAPPLVAEKIRRNIRVGVIVVHVLAIGVPLAVMCVSRWITAPPERLVVFDITFDALPGLPDDGGDVGDDGGDTSIPEPPIDIPDPTPPVNTPNMAAVPLPPGVLDNKPVPTNDPIPKPPDKPQEKPPQKPPDKPTQKPQEKPPQKPPVNQGGNRADFTPVDPNTLGKGGSKPGENNTGKNTGGGGGGTGTQSEIAAYNSRLMGHIAAKWSKYTTDGYWENVPQISIIISATSTGKVTAARIKQKTGHNTLDTRAQKLCDELLNSNIPAPGAKIPINELEIILNSQ